MTSNIFIDRTEPKHNYKISLSKNEVFEMIPKNALRQPNNTLSETMQEMRWRIFKFPNKENEMIEISIKNPIGERMYMNNEGKWKESKVPDELDVFITDTYYIYSKIHIEDI